MNQSIHSKGIAVINKLQTNEITFKTAKITQNNFSLATTFNLQSNSTNLPFHNVVEALKTFDILKSICGPKLEGCQSVSVDDVTESKKLQNNVFDSLVGLKKTTSQLLKKIN